MQRAVVSADETRGSRRMFQLPAQRSPPALNSREMRGVCGASNGAWARPQDPCAWVIGPRGQAGWRRTRDPAGRHRWSPPPQHELHHAPPRACSNPRRQPLIECGSAAAWHGMTLAISCLVLGGLGGAVAPDALHTCLRLCRLVRPTSPVLAAAAGGLPPPELEALSYGKVGYV